MAESHAVQQLLDAVRAMPRANVQRIENSFGVGIPDCYVTIDGVSRWIEAKHVTAWPKRAATVVKLDEPFKSAQRTWMHREHRAGGDPLLFVRVAQHEFFLFDALYAITHIERDARRSDWAEGCYWHYSGALASGYGVVALRAALSRRSGHPRASQNP